MLITIGKIESSLYKNGFLVGQNFTPDLEMSHKEPLNMLEA